jgi:hypothetical protein
MARTAGPRCHEEPPFLAALNLETLHSFISVGIYQYGLPCGFQHARI